MADFNYDDRFLFEFSNDINALIIICRENDPDFPTPDTLPEDHPFNDARDMWELESYLLLIRLYNNKKLIPLLLGISKNIDIYMSDILVEGKDVLTLIIKKIFSKMMAFGFRTTLPIWNETFLSSDFRSKIKKEMAILDFKMRFYKEIIPYTYKRPPKNG